MAQLAHVIQQLGAGTQVTAFFLVLARVTPLFVLAPLFSSPMLPRQVRGLLAVALSLGLTPVALHGVHLPGQALPVAGLIVVQLVTGLAFAFGIGVVYTAVVAAGDLADFMSGFTFGASIDPIDGNQAGAFGQLYGLVGTMVFLAIGGDAWTLRGLARTFQLVPLSGAPKLDSLTTGVMQAFSSIFVSALEIVAPVMLALLITDVALGVVSRAMPQLNVFGVGLPLKVGVALLVVGASLALLGNWMASQIGSSVGSALQAL